MSAGAALEAAAIAALRATGRFTSVQARAPVQAALPHAIVEIGPETDWGHKSGAGRALRLAVRVRAGGEHGGRLRELAAAAEAAIGGIAAVDGWMLVTLVFERSRTVGEAKGVSATVLEYRARMLAWGAG